MADPPRTAPTRWRLCLVFGHRWHRWAWTASDVFPSYCERCGRSRAR